MEKSLKGIVPNRNYYKLKIKRKIPSGILDGQ